LKKKLYLILSIVTLISGCGETTTDDGYAVYIPTPTPTKTTTIVSPSATPTQIPSDANSSKTKIIGKITYDRVMVKIIKSEQRAKLDYNNIQTNSAKWVKVELVDGTCGSQNIIATTKTDENGNYGFYNIDKGQNLKVCVYSKMEEREKYNVEVRDNTNRDAIYVISSSNFSTDSSKRVDLHAESGWGGYSYTGIRQSAPFAILDSIYHAMKKVLEADPNAFFPKLKVNWSVNNVPNGTGNENELRDGLIGTTHFDGEESLYILGKENLDTDEFDDHIIVHEWGHYFEEKFSRADSIGGSHGSGDRLDIRVSFGEGWGNAWSAIATDNPIYFDTQGVRQSDGFYMDIENGESLIKGFFSEDSIQHILYDIYDSNDDGADRLSMGFKPIYKTLTTFQKNTKAFTSIFTFIKGLEEQNPSKMDKIDTILESENISHINDIYGSNIDSNLYGDIVDLSNGYGCTSGRYGIFNKLYNHKYLRFNIEESGYYQIEVVQNNGSGSDPDFGVYKTSPFTHLGDSQATEINREKDDYPLKNGEYLLDISDYNGLLDACFTITIKKIR